VNLSFTRNGNETFFTLRDRKELRKKLNFYLTFKWKSAQKSQAVSLHFSSLFHAAELSNSLSNLLFSISHACDTFHSTLGGVRALIVLSAHIVIDFTVF
jgi:hypothetical protein